MGTKIVGAVYTVVGIILILMGGLIIATAPFDFFRLFDTPQPATGLFAELVNTMFWLARTIAYLVLGLIVAGIGFIIAGIANLQAKGEPKEKEIRSAPLAQIIIIVAVVVVIFTIVMVALAS